MKILNITRHILLILLATLLGCSEKNEAVRVERQGGTVTIALNTAIHDIFPLTTDEYNVDQIHRFMLTPSFVRFDKSGNALPQLADIWKIDEEKLSITFMLNPAYKWSNGKPVTIEDIQYTIDLLQSLKDSTRFDSKLQNIKSFDVPDSLSCSFTFKQAVAEPIYFTNFPIFPVQNEYDTTNINTFKESYASQFIGCGPFKIDSYNNDSLVLLKNEYYPGELPNLDKVVFKYIGESDQLLTLLKTNKIDFAVNVPVELNANKELLQKFEIMSYPEKGYTFIAWNLKSSLLKDKRMRLALSHSIDRQTLIDGILSGYGEKVDKPVYYNQKSANGDPAEIDFNTEEAERLFKTMGWNATDPEGFRVKKGKKLSLIMLVNQENKERIEIARNIKSNLKAMGVDLQLQFVSWKEILKAIETKSADALMLTWTDSDYYDPSLLFHSDGIANGLNFMSYQSDVADSLIKSALFSWNDKQKEKSWQAFQNKIAEDLPCTFLFSQKIIVLKNKKIQNVMMDSRGFLLNIKEWWINNSQTQKQ